MCSYLNLTIFPRVDSSAVPVQHRVGAFRIPPRRTPQPSVPLRSPHPPFRTVTPRVQMARLWKPPSHLHHPVPPVQPVVASAYFAGQTARQLNNLPRHCPPQACLRCSSSSIKRKAVHLHQRSPDPLEIRFYQSPSPRTEHQRRMSSQTPLPPRTARISPSHSPTSLPTITRKPPPTASPPPTRRMLLL